MIYYGSRMFREMVGPVCVFIYLCGMAWHFRGQWMPCHCKMFFMDVTGKVDGITPRIVLVLFKIARLLFGLLMYSCVGCVLCAVCTVYWVRCTVHVFCRSNRINAYKSMRYSNNYNVNVKRN